VYRDARFVRVLTEEFAATASRIVFSIDEANTAIEGMATAAEEATASSQEIGNNVSETAKFPEEVSKNSPGQNGREADSLVAKFKL
jgi:methyl-accepting chemotaxis protein